MRWNESIQTPEGVRRHAWPKEYTDGLSWRLTDFGGQKMILEETPGWRLLANAERGAGRCWHVTIRPGRGRRRKTYFAFTKDEAIDYMFGRKT